MGRTWGLSPKMALWLYKHVIILKITYAAVTWWDIINIALARSKLERLQRVACIMITGTMRTTPTKVLEMFLDLPTLGTAVESAALMAAYRLPRPNPKNLGIEHNRIGVKADKMDNKFNKIKENATLRRMFGKYRNMIPTREGWDKDWPNWLKGRSGSQMEPVISKGLGPELANIKGKYNSTSHWDRMLQPFRRRLRQY